MFVVNEDKSIYATRGDVVFFSVMAEDAGIKYKFQPGDVVRFTAYGKKDAENVVLQKDFPVSEVCESVYIYLNEEDTRFGEIISKPRDYWYEVELNPDTQPQTIIGYDEDGPKVFKLFPEGEEIGSYEPVPEDFPVVDNELDMTSPRPVSNAAVAAAIANITDVCERTNAAVSKNFVTPEMFGAIGDGVADDTEALRNALNSGAKTVMLNNIYRITDSLKVNSNTTVFFSGSIIADRKADGSFYSAIKLEDVENVVLYDPHLLCGYDIETEWSHGIMLNRTRHVTMHNVVCEGFADGVCVSYSADSDSYNDNLYIDSVIADQCKRNGVTVECCKDSYIGRIVGNEISGFAPNTCLDIEQDKSGLVIDNLVIGDVYSYKCGGGVNFVLDGQANVKVNSIDITDGNFYITGGESKIEIGSMRCVYTDKVYEFKVMDNASVALHTNLTIKSLVFEGSNVSTVDQLIYVKCNSNTYVDIEHLKVAGMAVGYLYYIDNYTDSEDYYTHCRLYGVDLIGNKVVRRANVKWLNEFRTDFEDETFSYSPVLVVKEAVTKLRNEWRGCEVTFEVGTGGSLTICEYSNFKPSVVLNTEGDRIRVAFEHNPDSSKAKWKVKDCFLLTV